MYNIYKFSGNFKDYYKLTNINDISINYSNSIKKFAYNKLLYNASEHIKCENERIEKEIVESMRAELEY